MQGSQHLLNMWHQNTTNKDFHQCHWLIVFSVFDETQWHKGWMCGTVT